MSEPVYDALTHSGFSNEKDADAVIAEATALGATLVRRHDATTTDGDSVSVLLFHHVGKVWQVVEASKSARERQRLRGRYLDRWSVRSLGDLEASKWDAKAEGRAE